MHWYQLFLASSGEFSRTLACAKPAFSMFVMDVAVSPCVPIQTRIVSLSDRDQAVFIKKGHHGQTVSRHRTLPTPLANSEAFTLVFLATLPRNHSHALHRSFRPSGPKVRPGHLLIQILALFY